MDFLASERGANRLFSLLAFFVLPLCALILTNKADPDLWMHLTAGRLIAETGGVPQRDLYSFAAYGTEWVSHEWLFQLLAYCTFQALGAAGLMAAKGAAGAAALYLIYRTIALNAESLVVRSFVFLCTSVVLICLGLTCRPQIATFLGCALLLYLHHRRRLEWGPWLLVPWSWLHGGFLAGIAILLVVCAGEALSGRPFRRLLFHTALAAAATLLNPYGSRLWTRILETLTLPSLGRHVIEWQPFWGSGVALYRWIIVSFAAALAVGFAADRDRKRRLTPWLLAAAGLAASLFSVRHLLLLAILSAAPIAASLERLRGSLSARGAANRYFLSTFSALMIAAMLLPALFISSRDVPVGAIAIQEEGGGWVAYPKGAARFIQGNRLEGRLWSDVNAGGYLVWHLYPACLVFMDTRLEHVYSEAQMADYLTATAAAPGWDAVLAKHRPDMLLLPASSPLASAAARADWRPLYRDPDHILLAQDRPAFSALIEAYRKEPKLSPRPALPWLFP